jgi:lipopolysaccharide assembly protein A
MIFVLILGFVLGAAAFLFILQNTAVVAVSFLNWQFETSVALVVIMSLLVGCILTLLATLPGAIGNSFRIHRLRKNNEELAKEAELQKQKADEAAARLNGAQANGVPPSDLH